MPDLPSDLLNRTHKIEAFTKIVTGVGAPKVVSVEAGFGVGKTTFAQLWKESLKHENRHVVMLNAWAAEQGVDPLATLLAGMLDALPEDRRSNENTRKKLGGLALSLLKSGYRIGGKAILRDGFGEANEIVQGGLEKVSDWISSVLPPSPDSNTEEPVGDSADSGLGEKLGKDVSTLLTGELESLIFRKESQKKAIQQMRELLTGSPSGQVIVIIDELDRCRPDAALSMLEAMKHVFDYEGFTFILMANAARLENIAARTFGEPVAGEPYLAKFINLRLQLGAGELENFLTVKAEALRRISYTTLNAEGFTFDDMVQEVASLNTLQYYSARSVERGLDAVIVALLLYPNEPILLDLLILMALQSAQSDKPINQWRHLYETRAAVETNKLPAFMSPHTKLNEYKRIRESRHHLASIRVDSLKLYFGTESVFDRSEIISKISDQSLTYVDHELQILTEHHARILGAAQALTVE